MTPPPPTPGPRYHPPHRSGWRAMLHEVIFEADTRLGKIFDVGLIVCIVASVLVVMLDSVTAVRLDHGPALRILEWGFTLLFTVEYVLRLLAVGRPLRYARSFFGIIDLLAVLPTYLSLLFPGGQYFITIRILRMLRVFRVLKLGHYLGAAHQLKAALTASRIKITVFLVAVLTMVVVMGSLMYVIEGEANGFTSIPKSVYWAVVTLTTVGYGDISPNTPLGQALAAMIMIMGYAIIAVPTGIVTAEMTQQRFREEISTQACPECGAEGHDPDARHCKFCGGAL